LLSCFFFGRNPACPLNFSTRRRKERFSGIATREGRHGTATEGGGGGDNLAILILNLPFVFLSVPSLGKLKKRRSNLKNLNLQKPKVLLYACIRACTVQVP
jgi:hypothetical protein